MRWHVHGFPHSLEQHKLITTPSRRLRRANLDIPGRIRFITSRADTTTIYPTTVCDLSDLGAMVIVDISCSERLRLFEKIRYCILELDNLNAFGEGILAKAVYFQPQTSIGDIMTFKVGLAFEGHSAETKQQIRNYLAAL